jgi:hypothetical protein
MTRTGNSQPKENSPFTPGQPAPPEVFTGRAEELQRLRRCIMQTASGKPQAVFICGERGLGKSSLARFCEFLVIQDNPMIPADVKFMSAYNTCGACRDVTDICKVVVQNLTADITEESRVEKAKQLLGRYIDDISVPLPGFRLSVKLKRSAEDLKDLRLNMPDVVADLWKIMQERKKGVMIILDEVNGVTSQADFASFIKSFWEDLGAKHIPVLLILVGLEQRLSDLIQANESVGRIFERILLRPMAPKDAKQFFRNAFARVNLSVTKEAEETLADLSGGYPVMMHEIGDATFWENKDAKIDEADAVSGLFTAATRVGEKYFSSQVYKEVQSETYRRILFHTVAKTALPREILRSQLQTSLPNEDAKTLDNFFTRMVKLGVMRRKHPGAYEYTYPMFPLYLGLEKMKQERAR